MSEDQTPYTTEISDQDSVVSDVVSGRLIDCACPCCGEALRVLISDDGTLLHLAAKTPEPTDEPDE